MKRHAPTNDAKAPDATSRTVSISIIIPAYNEADTILDCLQAIASQTEAPDEVIVIDNNSTDATVALASAYPFVSVIHEPRQGLFYSRNAGMAAAKGDILARIDADTIVDPAWVVAIREAFQDQTVCAVSGPVGYYDMPFPKFIQRAEDRCLRLAKAGRYDFLMGANMAIRRSVWDIVSGELCNEPFLFEDIDIAVHLASHDLYPAYSTDMTANVSARRLADKPLDFIRYIGGHTRTWEYHGLQASLGSYYAEAVFLAVYGIIKPLHMVYDPDLRRIDMRRLLQTTKARPDPMAVD